MIDLVFWAPVMGGGLLAGASSGVLGTFIVGMRIPFLGVCVAHAALAGAVFGSLCGMTGPWLLAPAMAGAVTTALILGLVNPRRARLDDNTVLSFLFSATMGLAFLGIGLHGVLGRSDNEVRSLLWGSLNFCRWEDVQWMIAPPWHWSCSLPDPNGINLRTFMGAHVFQRAGRGLDRSSSRVRGTTPHKKPTLRIILS
jgi:manganese/iron transport system permease protein